MRFVTITAGVPNPTTGGGALTAYSVLTALVRAGHSAAAYVLVNGASGPGSRGWRSQLESLRQNGVRVVPIEHQPVPAARKSWLDRSGRLLCPRLEEYYPTAALASELRSHLSAERPDAIFAYHFEPLAALHGLDIAPVMAVVGDPSHLPDFYRWKDERPRFKPTYWRQTARMAAQMVHMPRFMRAMLSSCSASGAFAAHHASWLEKLGVRGCQYFRTPVIDDAGPDWEQQRLRLASKGKPRILLIGHLRGIATLSGLYLFFEDVLPRLESLLGRNEFEVHVVGGFEPPRRLQRLMQHPSVILHGQVQPAWDEFLSSDVLVVPTPIQLGIRVRILTGFSFGCCVVTHSANALGIPELVHGDNALLAADGASMARCITLALQDGTLRKRLGLQARRTYEAAFSVESAGAQVLSELERIARQ